jgi:hypothetical protein
MLMLIVTQDIPTETDNSKVGLINQRRQKDVHYPPLTNKQQLAS